MELPRESSRPLGNKGTKATHDFLSLYSSPVQQDPTPPQGGYLKTHDFLQPLEVVGKSVVKEDNRVGKTVIEKPLPQPPSPSPSPSVEHILPGGIGTYSISYLNNQRCLKPEGTLFTSQSSNTTRNDENSNCSSYSGSGFTLWDESAVKQGKTGKENISAERHVMQEAGINLRGGQWPPVMERRSHSPSNNKHTPATFSSFSSSQPSTSQKNQSFMDMITSAKNDQEEDDDDDDDDEFSIKKEHSSHPKGNLPVKVEAKTMDQKPNTPRSKHSATEQRRRSKINDRFQKLREIIPNSDQKRDKASFLLEVIEYIQFLQEKVTKYDSPYPPPWNHEPTKMMQWSNRQMAEVFIDPTRVINMGANPSALFVSKSEDNKACLSPATPANGQTIIDSDISTATTFKQRGQLPELTSKETLVRPSVKPNMFAFGRSISAPPITPKQTSDMEKATSWPPPQTIQSRPCSSNCTGSSDKLKDQDITIESGTINISSVYSQRLLSSLTQALQSSGVDLSQANISVQIDLGKTRSGIVNSPASNVKDNDVPTRLRHSGVGSTREEYEHALKRLRTS